MQIMQRNDWPMFAHATPALVNDKPAVPVVARNGSDAVIEIIIKGVREIIVPVEDVVVEVTPPNRSVALLLSRQRAHESRRSMPDQLHSLVFFNCDDIQQIYHDLTKRGVRFPVPPVKMPFGWLSIFEDDEGRCYVLGQW